MTPEASAQAIAERPAGRPFPWPCPRCGKKAVWPVIMPYQSKFWYEDQLYLVDTPRLNVPRCSECGELLFDNWADEQINRAFRVQAALLSPEQIRANRTALGLGRRELAGRLGVEEDLVRRWEENATLHSRVVDNLLRLYFAFPEVRTALSDQPHPDLGTSVLQ
jgi:DNA-binding transcriptional regulator YiaG